MPTLFLITGSSGVGKSTILPFLKDRLSTEFDAHDFDERLTKEVALDGSLVDQWRHQTTKHWIGLATENAQTSKSTVVIGLIYPEEVLELKTTVPTKFCFLGASDEQIRHRLMGKRFSAPEKIAGLKQATGQTPDEFMAANKLIIEKLQNQVVSASGNIVDTTGDDPEETAQKIISWILKN